MNGFGRSRLFRSAHVTALLLFLVSFQFQPLCSGQDVINGQDKQPVANDPTIGVVDHATITAAIAQLQTLTDLDEATKAAATQLYQTALKRLESRDQSLAKIAEHDNEIQSAPQAIASAKNRKGHSSDDPPTLALGLTLEQIEQRKLQQQAEIDRLRKLTEQLGTEPSRRRARIVELPQLVTQLKTQLDDINNQLATPAPPGERTELTRARRTQLLAHQLMLQAELEKLDREQAFYSATAELLPEETALAKEELEQAQAFLDQIQAALLQRQESLTQRLIRETQEELASAPTQLARLAEENVRRAEQYRDLIEANAKHLARLKDVRDRIDQVDRHFKTATERVKTVGLTDALGVMLKQQRRELEDLLARYRPDPKLKDEVRKLHVASFQLQDELASRGDESSDIATELQRLGAVGDQAARLRPIVRTYITRRRTLTDDANQANDSTFQNLVALDTDQHKLETMIQEFANYIDQHVIWIPSAPFLTRGDWRHVVAASLWLANPQSWALAIREPWRDIATLPLIYLPLCLSLVLLFVFHRRLKRIVGETGEEARRGRCAVIHPTLNSLLATALMTALWPLVLAVFGWMLSATPTDDEFVSALGAAFLSVAIFVAPLELLRHVCRHNGLAESHFDWSDRVRRFFGQNVKVFYILAAPLLAIVVVMEHQSNEEWKNSLGRLAAIAFFILVAYFLHLTLRSKGVVFQQMSIRRSETQFFRLRHFWYLAIVGIPIFLLFAAMSGYYYAAIQLGACLQKSIAIVIGIIVIGGVLMRWLLVRRRSVAIEEARKARQAQTSPSPLLDAVGGGAEMAAMSIQDKPVIDLASVSNQAKEVVIFALAAITFVLLWWIWRDVLPAVGLLDRIVLWSVTVGERVEVVSLQGLFYALLVFAFTFLLIKNMSGVLNLAVLQYSSLDSGARYAATTIFRYLFTVVGAIVALSFLRIPWSQYGWLVAAVTVGLGFGLQEIVANFVSGLILLFERPVRVGDVVTIDNTTGVVTRIQMRATTVTNWDHQELIVPNKEFITGKLLNWTLSNLINRLVLNVGVAYGSDTDFVKSLLLKVVTEHPDVLKDPAPQVNFDGFGDSSLNFVIRCFLGNIDKRLPAKHELNTAIHQILAKHGITIPFPQREIRIIERRHDSPSK